MPHCRCGVRYIWLMSATERQVRPPLARQSYSIVSVTSMIPRFSIQRYRGIGECSRLISPGGRVELCRDNPRTTSIPRYLPTIPAPPSTPSRQHPGGPIAATSVSPGPLIHLFSPLGPSNYSTSKSAQREPVTHPPAGAPIEPYCPSVSPWLTTSHHDPRPHQSHRLPCFLRLPAAAALLGRWGHPNFCRCRKGPAVSLFVVPDPPSLRLPPTDAI